MKGGMRYIFIRKGQFYANKSMCVKGQDTEKIFANNSLNKPVQ